MTVRWQQLEIYHQPQDSFTPFIISQDGQKEVSTYLIMNIKNTEM